jgi:hypothetical protein
MGKTTQRVITSLFFVNATHQFLYNHQAFVVKIIKGQLEMHKKKPYFHIYIS